MSSTYRDSVDRNAVGSEQEMDTLDYAIDCDK